MIMWFILFILFLNASCILGRQLADLEDCLQKTGVPFQERETTGWELHTKPYNVRVPYEPAALVLPTTIRHIQDAVQCGVKTNFRVNARGGGHSYISLSLGGEDGHVVIKLSRMNNVALDPATNVATIQGGARLGHVATELYTQGRRAISHGTCPGVGIGGHSLHGGFGMSSHFKGLAQDWMLSATVVLANGTTAHCSESSNPDLFWAIRGAGSNFGVIAQFEFRTFPAPDVLTPFTVDLPWSSRDEIIAGLEALRDFAKDTMPPDLNMRLAVNRHESRLEGVFYGDTENLELAIGPLLNSTNATITKSQTAGWLEELEWFSEGQSLDQTETYDMHDNFCAKGLTLRDLQGQSLHNFVDYWKTKAASMPSTRGWWFQLSIHGGKNSAVSKVKRNATAYAHRDKLFLLQLYERAPLDSTYPDDGATFLDGWVDAIVKPLAPNDWAAYINYADNNMNRTYSQRLFWGDNLPRLQQLKAVYDPSETFYHPQSLEALDLR